MAAASACERRTGMSVRRETRYKVWDGCDDIAWMKIGADAICTRLSGVGIFFGVGRRAGDQSERKWSVEVNTISQHGRDGGEEPWWAGIAESPGGLITWGEKWTLEGWRASEARTTVPASQSPSIRLSGSAGGRRFRVHFWRQRARAGSAGLSSFYWHTAFCRRDGWRDRGDDGVGITRRDPWDAALLRYTWRTYF